MDPYGNNRQFNNERKVLNPFDDEEQDGDETMSGANSNAWAQSNWRASAPQDLPEPTERELPSDILTRSVKVIPQQGGSDFSNNWGAPAPDPFSGFSNGFDGDPFGSSKKLGGELPPLSMTSMTSSAPAPLPSINTALQGVPLHFSRSTSFYSNSSQTSLVELLVSHFKTVPQVDFDCEGEKISGISQSSGGKQCSWAVSIFSCNPESKLLVEFKRTFGCGFAFREFYSSCVASPMVAKHISNLACANAPAATAMPQDELPLGNMCDFGGDLPPLDFGGLGDDLGGDLCGLGLPGLGGLGNVDPVDRAMELLRSKFVDEQRSGAQSLVLITRGVMGQDIVERLISGFCSMKGGLLQSMDSDVARHACEILENLCKNTLSCESSGAMIWQGMLHHMMNVLDSPDSLSTRKCKRHVAKALQIVTASRCCEIPSGLQNQYLSILREYTKHNDLSPSINATLHQLKVN